MTNLPPYDEYTRELNSFDSRVIIGFISLKQAFFRPRRKNSRRKKLKTQGKNSKLKENSPFSGISENNRWPRCAQKKEPALPY